MAPIYQIAFWQCARKMNNIFGFCCLGQDLRMIPHTKQLQGGSNMTGTDLCVNKCKQSQSYLNHLVLPLDASLTVVIQFCFHYINNYKIPVKTQLHNILIKSNKMQQYAGVYLLQNHSTCFGCPSHPSSGVHKTETAAPGAGHSI